MYEYHLTPGQSSPSLQYASFARRICSQHEMEAENMRELKCTSFVWRTLSVWVEKLPIHIVQSDFIRC